MKGLIKMLCSPVRPSFITLGLRNGTVDKKFVDVFTDQYLHFAEMVKLHKVSQAKPIEVQASSFGGTFTPLGSNTTITLDQLN